MKNTKLLNTLIFIGILLTSITAHGRSLYPPKECITPVHKTTASTPYVDYKVHNIGKLGLTISNVGSFGTGFIGDQMDPTTGLPAPSGVYPYPGQIKYNFAGCFWVGAVVRRDTLVSVGADGWHLTREMWPNEYPLGAIEYHSISDPEDLDAISEQDFIAVYTDTLTDPGYVESDPRDGRPHIPLNIEIIQRSYAWSYAYAEDFILFDYSIRNIGRAELENAYISIYLDAECRRLNNAQIPDEFQDDICGFRRYIESPMGCGFIDTINTAWVADNDGRHNEYEEACPNGFEMTSIAGIRVVRTPSDSLNYSFNWWVSNMDASLDFGPRQAELDGFQIFRDFGGFLGTPEGDKNKYYVMRHKEFDYDQIFSAVDHTSDGWLPPPAQAVDFADGYDTRFLLSFGPFNISPGETLPVSFAYVHGENFHHDCTAFERLFRANPYTPELYYDQLNFSDFGLNTMWASWIYDNPGYDTDGDGYKGKYRICVFDSMLVDTVISEYPLITDTFWQYTMVDTLYYEGDGVPDFRGASPPHPPELRITPYIDEYNLGNIIIRWNGLRSETERDIFSNLIDFEGYRVYYALSPEISSYVLICSYDIENFNKYIWNSLRSIWELLDQPFTTDSIQTLYDINLSESPELLGIDNQFHWMDSIFYFNQQDWNHSDYRDTNLIHKRYPDEPYPSTLNIDSAMLDNPSELTAEGFFKYFEYEYTIKKLLPSQLYYISVTAFDFGSPKSGLPALESSQKHNVVAEFALNQNSIVEAENLDVIVYPNPYRIDANYREYGFEGQGKEDFMDDRVRSIHFINLPPLCTIRIFTIDGDLLKEIEHNCEYNSPQCMHEEWDVVTRNMQAPASGIYYWTVTSPSRTQIGKLVIIK